MFLEKNISNNIRPLRGRMNYDNEFSVGNTVCNNPEGI